jgi:hypothetical protein
MDQGIVGVREILIKLSWNATLQNLQQRATCVSTGNPTANECAILLKAVCINHNNDLCRLVPSEEGMCSLRWCRGGGFHSLAGPFGQLPTLGGTFYECRPIERDVQEVDLQGD